ncbi:5'-nucleotidase [Thalassovita gelatinovora]|uniref:5'-deoxynucleotidase n=1 Tax=Thalassovita gelatinovora TaxID=53501 RepID=A0A0P1F4S7_THAGE|nr:HD domain-containing protein [Thalassovita gelatinovora]QIZ79425.1 HD domain-containing protein [Thalassovita gelatinovora]CUH62782.1 5'-nucleotidase [Thalassovita gelatinovora]SEQ10044.1 putative hydrolases of HD superfamily [Thalassovita gelatinovora]
MNPRLDAQLGFLTEACRLKQIDRQNRLQDLSRPENSAEHSWHAALYALVMLPPGFDPVLRDRAIAMILLHDLVEIDAGDHPIHEDHDPDAIARAERRAAERLFGLLPCDQAQQLRALWDEFETCDTDAARLAKHMDHVQPIIQAVSPETPPIDQIAVVRGNLATGRARHLHRDWSDMHLQVQVLMDNAALTGSDLSRRIAFLNEADALKSIYRATRIAGGSRFENSAEHSWHLALYALVLAEHADTGVDIARVIRMLLIHDLVEIDAGDAPIFGDYDAAVKEAEEVAAARRIFGLLPEGQAEELLALWLEFEANETADARFAKALDRFQPPNQNLASGGGSWIDYDVDFETISARVGAKIAHGAPVLWDWIAPKIQDFLATKV